MSTLEIVRATEEISQFLATSPSPAQILAYEVAESLQARLRYLLDKHQKEGLNREENAELDEMEQMDHFMTMLKIKIVKRESARQL